MIRAALSVGDERVAGRDARGDFAAVVGQPRAIRLDRKVHQACGDFLPRIDEYHHSRSRTMNPPASALTS